MHTYPLTSSQLSIWMGQKMTPNSALYNMAFTFDLYGKIDHGVLNRSFQLVIGHYDALRLVFGEDNDHKPFQKVLPDYKFDIGFRDLSAESDPEPKMEALIREAVHERFDPQKPLFDSFLIKKNEEQYTWFLNVHHLVTDITSIQLIFHKTATYYHKLLKGETIQEPVESFLDLVGYEQQCLRDPAKKAQYRFWEELARSAPPMHKLYGQERGSSTTSVRVKVPFRPDQHESIDRLIAQNAYRSLNDDLSRYMVFSTLLVAFIHKVSGDQTITVGSPTYNRPSSKYKTIAGLFIDLLPFRVALDEQETFNSLYLKVRKSIYAMLQNTVPGVDASELSRTIGAVLNFITIRFGSFGDIPAHTTWLDSSHIDTGHQLRLQVFDLHGTGPELHFDINTSAFTESQIARIPDHFTNMADALLEDQARALKTVGLVGKKESDQLIAHINNAGRKDFGKIDILETFHNVCARQPQDIALVQGDQTVTYLELDRRSSQLANYLHAEGIGMGCRVALHAGRSISFVTSVLGILKSGACYIPIPTDYPPQRVRNILEDVEPSLLLTEPLLSEKLKDIAVPVGDLPEVLRKAGHMPDTCTLPKPESGDAAYIMYTSGSTGKPKGVIISHGALGNYLMAAQDLYLDGQKAIAPLFTSIGFDLTVTSLFLPLLSGGSLRIYEEEYTGHDLSVLKVIGDQHINFIKLTPSHARLIADLDLSHSNITTMILGGEDLDKALAGRISAGFDHKIAIYNEYGPTEATVGCIVKKYDPTARYRGSIPVGLPFANATAFILDAGMNTVPQGVPGELFVGGPGLSDGYWNQPETTGRSFVRAAGLHDALLYRTGDLARLNEHGDIEYLGRADKQLKLGGIRIEGEEIESILLQYPGIQQVVVDQFHRDDNKYRAPERHCARCGLPSNYPNISFNEEGVCDLCSSFDNYQKNVQHYFGDLDALKTIMQRARARKKGRYDCMMLLSGGKDSSYALAQLVDLGLSVLAFTLENGYISDEAKANIKTVVDRLGVDHVYGTTEYMNEIFVDSIKRFSNVCNGCFKTLYTLSTQKALDLGIPVIITGLSRGQFFETRLTEELFRTKRFEVADIDQIILDARKAYHRIPDAVSKHLDVSMYDNDEVFERVQFVDFYRYCDVHMKEMLSYLDTRLGWKRPTDTGRSTNCLINDLGIYMHKKERGYHNYAFPYSWDVRMGHKNRDEAIDELNDQINEAEVKKMLGEIGYPRQRESADLQKQLVVYYKSAQPIPHDDLRKYLKDYLPESVIPANFVHIDAVPLTGNGKTDFNALAKLIEAAQPEQVEYVAPTNEIEEIVAAIWEEVLQIDHIGIDYPFLELGGNSLLAIRIISRINEQLHLDLKVTAIFEEDTIRKLASHIEVTIEKLLNEEAE
jgi:amino acid adenylation domain-containing protein